MSWFSDFAKNALNEAQKRIDKVLDIDDEVQGPKTDNSNSKNTSTVLDGSAAVNTQAKISVQQKSSLLSTHKSTVGSFTSKKRGKPLKLGNSLSKRQPSIKPQSQKANQEKNLESKPTNAQQPNEFEEISLDDSKATSTDTHFGADSNSSENCHELSDNVTVSDQLTLSFGLGKKNSSTTTLVPKSLEGSVDSEDILSNSVSDCEKHDDATFFPTQAVAQHNNPSAYQATSERSYSPCGSTTTSSEIDILDHESTISEASSAYKLTEFDGRLHLMGGDLNLHVRASPDPADSEASDIVRISGYCSSPLSVSSCDGVPVFSRSKSPVQFSDRREISPVKNTCAKRVEPSIIASEEDAMLEQSTSNSVVFVPEKNSRFFNSSLLLEESTATDPKSSVSLKDDAISEKQDEESKTLLSPTEETIEKIGTTNSENLDATLQAEKQTNDTDTAIHLSDEVKVLPSSAKENVDAEGNEDDKRPSQNKANVDSLAHLKEKFEVYEQQLVSLSLSNASLSEENDNLRSELSNFKLQSDKQFEERQQNVLDTVDKLSEKIQDLELEKCDLHSELESVRADLSGRLSNEQVQALLSEKEESIKGLLQEGETLSKTHLQQSNTIKKLRSKLSEHNSTEKELKEKLAKFEEENKSLKHKVAEIKGQSSEDRGTAERLSDAFHKRETQLNEMRSKLEDAEEKRRAAQSTLDAAYKDIAELNKKQAAVQSDREAELREREVVVAKRMQQEVAKLKQEHDHQMHMRLLQLGELQDSLERTEAICTRKEDQLRKEVKDLQQRLQDSELRNYELSESISESTRPILRQMESLQATYSTQIKTWEALEKSLTARLSDAQIQVAASQDKERSLQAACVELKSRLVAGERHLADIRREKASLDTELIQLRTNAAQYDHRIAKLQKDLQSSEANCEEVTSRAQRDKATLESQLEMEKVRSEVDRKKYLAQLEVAQKEKERLTWVSRAESVASSFSIVNTDAESVASSSDTFNNFDVFERQSSTSAPPSGVYDSLRAATNTGSSLLENLQSQLKMRDGEIAQLQGEINTLERTRSSMAEEIVRLTNDNDDLQEIAKEVEDLKANLKEMEGRHETALTMYGEKAEEAEELKLDLEDVKTMYRNQIDALLKSS